MDGVRMVHFNPETSQTISVSPDLVQHYPCQDDDCLDCPEQYRHKDDMCYQQMHYTNSHNTLGAAAGEIGEYVYAAQEARTSLQRKLAKNGDLFMSRWKKRSREKRGDVLRAAHPLLPEVQNAQFFEFTQVGDWQNWRLARNPRFRLGLLLPYLAREKLKEDPSLMFALMCYRTKYGPEEWATFDSYIFQTPWRTGQLDVEFSPLCVVMHGSKYGELVPFEPNAAHRGDIVGFPRAQLILETQATLMEFLVNVFNYTLDGANLDNVSCEKWQEACYEGFRASGDVAQWSTYSHQPFSPPPVLDLDDFISTVQTRMDAIADHLSLLQTEPAYMRRYIRILAQGEVYKITTGVDSFKIAASTINLELTFLYWWLCVKEEAEHVQALQKRFRDSIHRGSPLPAKYDRALASLELVLVNFMLARGAIFMNNLDQRPGFSQYTSYEHHGDTKVTIARKDKGNIKAKYRTDPLYWCLIQLCAGPDQQGAIAHDQLFIFLEDYLATAPVKEKARLDQIIYDHFSDLALNHQLLLAVRLNRPQNKAGDGEEMMKTEYRRAWRDKLIHSGSVDYNPAHGALLKTFYDSPVPQGRFDPTWIRRFEDTHAALTAFWASVRNHAPDHMKDKTMAKYLRADLEPSHLIELKNRKQRVRDEMATKRTVPEFVSSIPATDQPTVAAGSSQPSSAKSKKKSRPARPDSDDMPTLKQEVGNNQDATVPEAESKPTIVTTKRACNIFSQTFADNIDDSAGKDCDWDQFVHAMKDVGFNVRNSAGSAVNFSLDERGAIVFHRPHPVPKIDPIMLKSMGKRLNKWFGWDKGTFVDAKL